MRMNHGASSLVRIGLLCLALIVLATGSARAEIYKYETEEGEVVLSTEKRDDLKLIEVLGVSPKRSKSESTATGELSSRSKVKINADQNAHDHLIREAAAAYGLPFAFIKAVVKIESNFNTHAVSRVGAMGLMQLMPATAEDMGVTDAFDARQNIFGGTKYLRMMANKYNGDINLVLAAYNAGPGNVDKYEGIPFESTRGYVQKVYSWYKEYESLESQATTESAPPAP
ncbi:MAG: hypothetical protein AUK47_12260 [Deltaproteobacteria bacterium CG2_30_63_29]|nr:MAG: hypothetical protein AUK47_12260 [Deltaproteobacteria bacterium CG2_30_63_29]